MLPQSETTDVSRRRALLTDRERELLRDEEAEDPRYVVISRVRTKIQEELEEDIEILQQHHSGLYDELLEVVCEDTPQPATVPEAPPRRDASPSPEPRRDAPEEKDTPPLEEPESQGVDLPTEIDGAVWSVVDEVSANWDDDTRLETRRKAAATALQYALTHDVHLGKSSDAIVAIRERYGVEGQNEDTWWRKNIREVLQEVGEYSKGQQGYSVEGIDDA